MASTSAHPLDPTLAVAALLTRIGVFAFVVIVPLASMLSRRAVAVIVPIAAVLLVVAAALDGRLAGALRRFGAALVTPVALAFAALIAFAALSLAWAPVAAPGIERLARIIPTMLLVTLVIASLPARSRSPDVNLVPIGFALSALALIVVAAGERGGVPAGGEVGPETERAAMLLVPILWPALAALLAKRRLWQAGALVMLAAGALWVVHGVLVLAAFVAGLAAFVAMTAAPGRTPVVVGGASLAALIGAPLLGWLMTRYGGFLLPREGDALVAVWRDVTYALPDHLLLGFGFEASQSLRRNVSGVMLGSPRNAGLQVWLELGLAGVALAAATLALAIRAMAAAPPLARPAAFGILASAMVLMVGGAAAWQIWWVTGLGLAAILTAFVGRGPVRPAAGVSLNQRLR